MSTMIGHYAAMFFGGMFLFNAVPHLSNGMSGRRFPTPFARLHGGHESSAKANVLWSVFNLALAYLLLVNPGAFDLHAVPDVATALVGGGLLGHRLAGRFGRFYSPPQST